MMSNEIAEVVEHDITVIQKAAEVAAELFKQAKTKGFDGAEGKFLLGMAAYTTRNYEVARDGLTSAYVDRPCAETAARLGMCELRAGNAEDAASWAQKAIKFDPKGAFRTYVSGNDVPYVSILAAAEFSRGNVTGAEKAAQVALEIGGGDGMAAQVLTLTKLLRGDLNGALESARDSSIVSGSTHPLAPILKLATDALKSGIDGIPLRLPDVPMGHYVRE